MHREGHHLNLSVQGNFGSGISGGFTTFQTLLLNFISSPRCLETLRTTLF